MITKPQWLFPLLFLLIMRKWRSLLGIGIGVLVVYGLANLVYLALVGIDYGSQSLQDYLTFLARIDQNYPWEIGTAMFTRMNHSVYQTVLAYVGAQPWVGAVSLAIKGVLVGALGWLLLRVWQTAKTSGEVVAGLVWVGYLVSMAMLSQLWELAAAGFIFVFIYAVGTQSLRLMIMPSLLYLYFEIPILLGLLTRIQQFILPQVLPLTLLALLLFMGALLVFISGQLVYVKEAYSASQSS